MVLYIVTATYCGKPRRSNVRKSTDSALVHHKLRFQKVAIVPDKKTHPEKHNQEKFKTADYSCIDSGCKARRWNYLWL